MCFFLIIRERNKEVVEGYVVLKKSKFDVFLICINCLEKNEKQEFIRVRMGDREMRSERSFSRQCFLYR